jgi:copper chaperone CopZ
MKSFKLSLAVAALAAFTLPLHAETSLTLSGVHNCCKGCAKGIEAAITGAGATAEIDGKKVVITASSEAKVKKAAEALLAAGYFGEGAEPAAVTDAKVKSATVGAVHLCCGKCVSAVEKAVKSVSGVTSHTAEKNADTFTVEGDFSTKELAEALNKAGFNGSIK